MSTASLRKELLANGKMAYTVILSNPHGKRIGIVALGEMGYYETDLDHHVTLDEVKEHVTLLNEQLGIPEDVAESMGLASMFGWDVECGTRAKLYFKNLEEKEGQ